MPPSTPGSPEPKKNRSPIALCSAILFRQIGRFPPRTPLRDDCRRDRSRSRFLTSPSQRLTIPDCHCSPMPSGRKFEPPFGPLVKFRSSHQLFTVAVLALSATSFAAFPPQSPEQSAPPILANFTDVAQPAGLTMQNVFGGVATKKYIIETTGTGVAIFDYDNDGWPDIFVVNGTTLQGFSSGEAPTNHLYHNNHDGTFTDVTVKAGLSATGWGQGVCVGDYDNDGWEDLYVTYYGKNRLYHNDHGVFTEVAEKAGVAGSGRAWGTGCAFIDYNRDGRLDLMVANYMDFNPATTPIPGEGANCVWKGVPVMCGPRGL